ncbi:hypothetical protein HQN60_11100 [Deefgea piscis]|uniref:Uncharacterized protein n=1 Tax=Deefgea piscis TaxID=2739061 RepID=A0A6M8SST8_9NEIS|nr:hypothetical protein [Deefgea piscis]QKJ67204.1 hypothetical protein HQN60_11100 [Deefgea piscis]
MKKLLCKFLVGSAKILLAVAVLALAYLFFLNRDIRRVDGFCSEMKAGLDVNKVHVIAEKYDVGFSSVRDPDSVKTQSLGVKLDDRENTWFFAVAAPMTMGEHACGIYHNNQVVLSVSPSRR